MPYKDPEKAREAWRRYYRDNPQAKKNVKKLKIERIAAGKNHIYEWLQTHPCVDCGEPDPIVLEFDHIGDKTAGVYDLVANGHGLQRIKDEIAETEVVCANCHKRRTSRRANDWKYQRMVTEDKG